MNATSQAIRGYAEHATSTRSNRRAEYQVIARVTQELRDKALDSKKNFAAYAEALHRNQRLWTALVVDIADADNPLPDELKARVIYLAEFTSHHTRRILRQKASVMPLLEINMAVLRGLKSEGPAT
ncbi:flagellar biosynthesis regulator FlaF [uncultured Tateyamaria sp.]|uniref:flagellar biosynthesis regulator FlaF n=1 Tax=uncultured Tateyamaria sp. TaxID=455651 RepID=UPI002608C73E|nr:flagellar biosynthesis regulator FlaF [uncultured Tateyamaria sp.]